MGGRYKEEYEYNSKCSPGIEPTGKMIFHVSRPSKLLCTCTHHDEWIVAVNSFATTAACVGNVIRCIPCGSCNDGDRWCDTKNLNI